LQSASTCFIFLPYINDWHVFDTKLQNLGMTYSPLKGDRRTQDDLVFKTTHVRSVARSKPRDIFGELKTEAFCVAEARENQANKAKEALQTLLGPMGLVVEKVLTNDYRFNPEYTKVIEDKKVADQQVEKNKSAQHAAIEEYKRKLEEAKGEVNKMVADARRSVPQR
jgi:regulator of protease activity HflC (stomatin/prohibitin superfamily)